MHGAINTLMVSKNAQNSILGYQRKENSNAILQKQHDYYFSCYMLYTYTNIRPTEINSSAFVYNCFMKI